MRFFVLGFCTDPFNIGLRRKLLSIFLFILEFSNILEFFFYQSAMTTYIDTEFQSPSTESLLSETPRQLSQRRMKLQVN
jgi:hypothetical protein